jgi:sugar O-acyltransferase (sialic acid O-acetyltransferase NeuD family)
MSTSQSKSPQSFEGATVVGLYGTGGFGREVMPVLQEYMATRSQTEPDSDFHIFFVETEPKQAEVNGYPMLSEKDFFDLRCGKRLFNIAIGNSRVRERIALSCIERGAQPLTIRSLDSISYDRNTIGEGSILCAQTMLTSNAKVGRFFHGNIYSYVAHDCVVGDFVTFAPGVKCNGNVHIHDHAYIGTGAVIKQGTDSEPLVIGEGAVVGMGAVVTKNVPPFTTVVGNPAKPHTKG